MVRWVLDEDGASLDADLDKDLQHREGNSTNNLFSEVFTGFSLDIVQL